MLKIWNMKAKEAAAEKKKPKVSAAQLRAQKGFYKGGQFNFTVNISNNYPHEPPKLRCTQKIYHPNIDLDGNICLNILREDWKPVLNLHSVLVGLQYLFLEPNADDPLNREAAEDLRANRRNFEANVRTSLRGGTIKGIHYDNVLVR
ncbi:hypothetical protein BZG36_00573 [Bifiguratus adelaidae]|uniref:NEDD8-conjugating enzyme UBC12 n=1 Tax=Bifiguratus adelaidae TaxID=1938954 RepID=A0A261Y7A2_9FUNG|nr:hypothetical protein BZG36_00573 [Bifiguratus adelaidae]